MCEACAWHARRVQSLWMARETYTKLLDGTVVVYEGHWWMARQTCMNVTGGWHGDLYVAREACIQMARLVRD